MNRIQEIRPGFRSAEGMGGGGRMTSILLTVLLPPFPPPTFFLPRPAFPGRRLHDDGNLSSRVRIDISDVRDKDLHRYSRTRNVLDAGISSERATVMIVIIGTQHSYSDVHKLAIGFSLHDSKEYIYDSHK